VVHRRGAAHNGDGQSNGGDSASDRTKKMTLGWAGPEWPGGPNATWSGTERKQRKIEMGRKDDWAEMFWVALRKRFLDFDSRNNIQM
jgi:hypothetical protein